MNKPVGADQFTVTVSTYQGHEEDVLQFRNRNRPVPRTRTYMDWRYLGQQSPFSPLVFWVRNCNDTPMGMASIIFRPFWVGGRAQHFAVLGDISVDREFRGRGISRILYSSINSYLIEQTSSIALVIANLPARRGLASSHWTTGGSFLRYLFFLNPAVKFDRLPRGSVISKLMEKVSRKVVRSVLLLFAPDSHMRLEFFTEFDSSIEALWQQLPKKELILSDRSASTLKWRYEKHPVTGYRFARLIDCRNVAGYLVFSVQSGEAIIFDILVAASKYVKPLLALFLLQMGEETGIDSVRLTVNEHHPYSSSLAKLGFVGRRDNDVFQIFTGNTSIADSGLTWLVVSGDKDV